MENYSVLMSVYKGENPLFFEESVKSIVNQTIQPNQFVLVKNGELTPELENVIEKYKKIFPTLFTIVSLKANESLGVALDAGIRVCRNQLIARMDSDDISLRTRCEKLLKKFEENSQLDICGTYMNEFYDNDIKKVRTCRTVPIGQKEIKKYVRTRSPFNHSTIMFKKDAVIRCGGYGLSSRKEDFDLFSRMLNMGCVGANIPEVLLLWRANVDSFKRKKSWLYCKDYITVMKRNLDRGYCSIWDYILVASYELLLFIFPVKVSEWFTKNVLRKKVKS